MNAALIVGISDYPSPISKLPAVAADVREIGKLLNSPSGKFPHHVKVLTDTQAGRENLLQHLQNVFDDAEKDDTIFVYMAGHGAVISDDYYFIAHDTDLMHATTTAVSLEAIKAMFDRCKSDRVLLWLDFCHSGGIIPRQIGKPPASGPAAIRRALEVVRGQGRIIFAACTPEQSAYENLKLGHGVFTAYLLEGLQGAAAQNGEITANSLFDFIDRSMGSSLQQPMLFGQMTGRMVLATQDSRQADSQESIQPNSVSDRSNVIESTGNWCLLGQSLFEAAKVHRSTDGNFVLDIPSTDSVTDAALAALAPGRFGSPKPMPFAHRSDGMLVRIASVESHSSGSEQVWSVVVKAEPNQGASFGTEIAFQSGNTFLSPDDQAKLRAGRLLLNDPPQLESERRGGTMMDKAFAESFIRGVGAAVSAKECIVRSVYTQMRKTDASFLRTVRLVAVFMLKATHVCEHILELKIGPISGGRCHVRFRGRRAALYQNSEPFEFELEGDCPLE